MVEIKSGEKITFPRVVPSEGPHFTPLSPNRGKAPVVRAHQGKNREGSGGGKREIEKSLFAFAEDMTGDEEVVEGRIIVVELLLLFSMEVVFELFRHCCSIIVILSL